MQVERVGRGDEIAEARRAAHDHFHHWAAHLARHAPHAGALAVVRAVGVERLEYAGRFVDATDLPRLEQPAHGAGDTW